MICSKQEWWGWSLINTCCVSLNFQIRKRMENGLCPGIEGYRRGNILMAECKGKKKVIIIIIENERKFQNLSNMQCKPSPGKCQVLPLKSHCPIPSLILNELTQMSKEECTSETKIEWPSMTCTWAVHHRIKIDIWMMRVGPRADPDWAKPWAEDQSIP